MSVPVRPGAEQHMTAARTRQRVRETLAEADGAALTATDVARRLGLTRSTALRHLDALAGEDLRVVERRLPENGNARSFALRDDVTTRQGTTYPDAVQAIAQALGIEPEDVEVNAAFSGFGVEMVAVPREALEHALGLHGGATLDGDAPVGGDAPIPLTPRAKEALGA